MANNGSNGKGKPLTNEQLKMLAELTLQNDERIEQIIGDLIELKIAAIEYGFWPRVDEQPLKDARRNRADLALLDKSQRQRLRKSLGLS
jgi:hypothetical protein